MVESTRPILSTQQRIWTSVGYESTEESNIARVINSIDIIIF